MYNIISAAHSERQLSLGEMMNFVEHRVASGVVSALTDRIEFAPGR